MMVNHAEFGFLCVIVLFVLKCSAIPIDNGVRDVPEIECGAKSITFNVATENVFEGHVYVKGRYDEPGCRDDRSGRATAGIILPFTDCGLSRVRSLNPQGIFVTTTIVISFHPNFLTKIDKAYRIQCFYMEADKTVDTDIEVSMITTDLRTVNIPMPVCRYEILDRADGNVIKYVLIGQSVYHKWTCDSETLNTFCMRVHSCFVTDETSMDRFDLIDEAGCTLDKFLLGSPEYPMALMAGVESHVFKYADRAQLYFQCQIEILVREPDANNPGEVLDCAVPQCENNRRKRQISSRFNNTRHSVSMRHNPNTVGTWDVLTDALEPLDIVDEKEQAKLPTAVRRLLSGSQEFDNIIEESEHERMICMSTNGFSASLALLVIILLSALTLSIVYIVKRGSSRQQPINYYS